MKGLIVIKGTMDGKTSGNIRGHVAMRLGRFDKIERVTIGDTMNTEVLSIRTSRKTFEELKEELNEFYPGKCMFLNKKWALA